MALDIMNHKDGFEIILFGVLQEICVLFRKNFFETLIENHRSYKLRNIEGSRTINYGL